MLYLLLAIYVIGVYFLGFYMGKEKALDSRLYHVKYVENCSAMARKTFATKAEAVKWVANFKLKYQGTRIEPDCWIDMIFKGDVVFDEGDPK